MKCIIGGLVYLVVGFVIVLIVCIIKAAKDPDVIAASNLKMDVRRYKKYREWYDEHQRLVRQYGLDSKEEQEYFLSFFKQIKNPNEWRRYQKFRFNECRRHQQFRFREIMSHLDEEVL